MKDGEVALSSALLPLGAAVKLSWTFVPEPHSQSCKAAAKLVTPGLRFFGTNAADSQRTFHLANEVKRKMSVGLCLIPRISSRNLASAT